MFWRIKPCIVQQRSTGAKILIIGASGGIGTAYLQLGKLADLTIYGIASKSKHAVLTQYGAIPIDYHTQNFVDVIRRLESEGIHAIFDGMGGDYIPKGMSILRRGGVFVEYGNPLTYSGMFRSLWQVISSSLRPNGIRFKLYGNSSRLSMKPFREDWARLFKYLEEGKIKPIIHKKFPILEAPQANALLESGQVVGYICYYHQSCCNHECCSTKRTEMGRVCLLPTASDLDHSKYSE